MFDLTPLSIGLMLFFGLIGQLMWSNFNLRSRVKKLEERATHLEIAYRAMVENATNEQIERQENLMEKRKNEDRIDRNFHSGRFG